MINPQFKARVSMKPIEPPGGLVYVRCPKCKKGLMHCDASVIHLRCKHCGVWVHLSRKNGGGEENA